MEVYCRLFLLSWSFVCTHSDTSNVNPSLFPVGDVLLTKNEKLMLTCVYQTNNSLTSFEVVWKQNRRNGAYWYSFSNTPCKSTSMRAPRISDHSCHMIPENNTYIFSLTTTTITDTDDGQIWQCTIHEVDFNGSAKGFESETTTVSLRVPPNITILNGSHAIINEGEGEAVLSCSVSGNPLPRLAWIIATGQTLVESPGPASSLDYILRDVDRAQAGIYSCSTWNVSDKPTVVNVTVDVHFPPNVTILNGSQIVIDEGDAEAVLSCSASGNPIPRLAWISDAGQTLVESPGPASSLDYTLRDVDRSQAGIYSCSAWNVAKKPTVAVLRVDINSHISKAERNMSGPTIAIPVIAGGAVTVVSLVVLVAIISGLVIRWNFQMPCTKHIDKRIEHADSDDTGYLTPQPIFQTRASAYLDNPYATIDDSSSINDSCKWTLDTTTLQYQRQDGTIPELSVDQWLTEDGYETVQDVKLSDKWCLNMGMTAKDIKKIKQGKRTKSYKRDPRSANKFDIVAWNHHEQGTVEKQTQL